MNWKFLSSSSALVILLLIPSSFSIDTAKEVINNMKRQRSDGKKYLQTKQLRRDWQSKERNSLCSSKLKNKQHPPPRKKRAEDLNEHFSKEDIQMANKHRENCSVSLVIREMQVEIKMRYHLTLVTKAVIKTYEQWVLERLWRKENPTALLVGKWIDFTVNENSMKVPLKTENRTTLDPAILFPGIHSGKSIIPKDACPPMFTAALFIIAST